MTTGNIIGITASTFFGLWLLIAPRSVFRCYAWFHDNRDFESLDPLLVRFGGLLWTILSLYVAWKVAHRPFGPPFPH
jgi:hypothetical protein